MIHIDAGPHRHVDKYDILDYLPELRLRHPALSRADGHQLRPDPQPLLALGPTRAAVQRSLGRADGQHVPHAGSVEEPRRRSRRPSASRRSASRSSGGPWTARTASSALTAVDRQQMIRHYGEHGADRRDPGRRRPRTFPTRRRKTKARAATRSGGRARRSAVRRAHPAAQGPRGAAASVRAPAATWTRGCSSSGGRPGTSPEVARDHAPAAPGDAAGRRRARPDSSARSRTSGCRCTTRRRM